MHRLNDADLLVCIIDSSFRESYAPTINPAVGC